METRLQTGLMMCLSVGLVYLAACSSNPALEPTPSPTAAATIDLRFTIWSDNPAHLSLLTAIADDYTAAHPDVTIQFDVIPTVDYSTTVALQLDGNNPPDGGWILENAAPEFVASGALSDLSAAIAQRPDYNYADFSDSALELWVTQDAIYGIPFSTSPFLILFNRDLFDAAGVDPPDVLYERGEWTWDALAAAGRQIMATASDSAYGFQGTDGRLYTDRPWHTLVPIIRAYGGRVWDDAGENCLLDAPEAVTAVTWFHDLIYMDRVVVPPEVNHDFYQGQAAMTIGQLSRVAQLRDAAFDWGMSPLPAGPAGDVSVIGQAGVVAFNTSPNLDAAVDFVLFLTNEANSARLVEFFPSARLTILRSDAFRTANPMVASSDMERSIIKPIATGRVLPYHHEFNAIDVAARLHFQQLWQPDADVAAVLSDVCMVIEPFLSPVQPDE